MILLALVAAEVAALVLAVVHARRCSSTKGGADYSKVLHPRETTRGRVRASEHAPLVLLIAFALASDLIHEALVRLVFTAPEHPLQEAMARLGWPGRALFHVNTALVLGWPASLAAAAWRVFGGHAGQVFGTPSSSPMQKQGPLCPGSRKHSPPQSSVAPHLAGGIGSAPIVSGSLVQSSSSRPKSSFMAWLLCSPCACIAIAWAFALAGMVVAHPLPRGWTQPVLHAWQLAMVGCAVSAILRAWGRAWSRAGIAVGVLVAVELTVGLIGAWSRDAFRQWDELARVPYAIGFAVVAGLHVVWLRRP